MVLKFLFVPLPQKETKHKNNYFYKFVFYWIKHHLKDKTNYWDFIKNEAIPILYTILFILLSCFVIIGYINKENINSSNLKEYLPHITAITVIITALFFIIKVYIDNLKIKGEKEMYKEMETRFDRQDKKFDDQNKYLMQNLMS